jgi:DNA-binding MurR/RpiR family transcriptional regulator
MASGPQKAREDAMGTHSCLYGIHSLIGSFSEKERKVAEYILANPQGAVHPSIEELAETIGVSESTLVRFVRKLGYGGYQQFRIALATETVSPDSLVYEAPVGSCGDDAAIVFGSAVNTLELTLKSLSRESLDRIAVAAVGARRIAFFGLGGSGLVARDACHKLIRSGLTCIAAEDFHLQLMMASQSGPADLAIVVSHTGANRDALALAEEAKGRGCRIVVITSNPRSPLAKLADELLVSVAPAATPVSEAFSARIAQLAIVDTLYVKVMEILGQRGLDSIERMRSSIAGRRT